MRKFIAHIYRMIPFEADSREAATSYLESLSSQLDSSWHLSAHEVEFHTDDSDDDLTPPTVVH